MGRTFIDDDAKPDSERVVIIGEKLWKRMFNSAPDVLGKILIVDGIPRTIVGVMPAIFDGPWPVSNIDLWIPLNPDTIFQDTGWVTFVMLNGTLRKDISAKVATEESSTLVRQIAESLPNENEDIIGTKLEFLNSSNTDGSDLIMFRSLLICALLILLMACGIASGLMTARYSARTQELAIRSALGASRFQIVSQMIAEFVVISICAMILGFLLAHWFEVSVLTTFYDRFGIPTFMRDTNNIVMALYIVAILIVVTFASTLMPALRASKTDLNSVLRESTRTGSSLRVTRLSNLLITWQVATACVVLCGGAIEGYALYDLHITKETIDPSEYQVARIAFNAHDHGDRPAKCHEVIQLLQRLKDNPQIEKAGLTSELFGYSRVWAFNSSVLVDGKDYASDNDVPGAFYRIVAPGYFAAINVPVIAGRDFDEKDDEKNNNVIVTETFARKFFGGVDVLGKRFKTEKKGGFQTIVGIVPDIYDTKGQQMHNSGYFISYASQPWDDIFIFIKGHGTMEQLRRVVTDTIEGVDSKICIASFDTLDNTRDQYGPATYLTFMFLLFIALSVGSLVMAAAGLYGVISFSSNMRKTEMGIRLALGASPSGLVNLMARKGFLYVAIGFAVGAGGTLILRYYFMKQNSTMPESPQAYAIAVTILLIVSIISILIPAILVAVSEPAHALRDD